MNQSPLGAAALAGTLYPIDRAYSASLLGFDKAMANSIDAVSARDFIVEFLSIASIHAMHLSRMAEEMVIFSSQHLVFCVFLMLFQQVRLLCHKNVILMELN